MIKKRVKIARFGAQILGKNIGIQNAAEPLQSEESVHRRRRIDPGKGKLRHEMDSSTSNGFDVFPNVVIRSPSCKFRLTRNNHFRIPQEQLLRRYGNQTTLSHAF